MEINEELKSIFDLWEKGWKVKAVAQYCLIKKTNFLEALPMLKREYEIYFFKKNFKCKCSIENIADCFKSDCKKQKI